MTMPHLQKPRILIVGIFLVSTLGAALYGLWYRTNHPAGGRGTSEAQESSASVLPSSSSTAGGQLNAQGVPLDLSKWKVLVNKYGWSLTYPNQWTAQGHEDDTAQSDIEPYIEGPDNCYAQRQECGYFSVGMWLGSLFPTSQTRKLSNLNAKSFLLDSEFSTPPDPNKVLLDQGSSTVDGQPAYYIVFRQTNFEDYPLGIIIEETVVKRQNMFYKISCYETGADKAHISKINSPRDWTLNPIFNQIASSIKFSR